MNVIEANRAYIEAALEYSNGTHDFECARCDLGGHDATVASIKICSRDRGCGIC